LLLQQVIDDQRGGDLVEDLPAQALAPDTTLQLREWQRRAIHPGQQLTIEHGPFRKQTPSLLHFRKSPGQQLLTPAPEKRAAGAANELSPDAVPLPLGDPVAGVSQLSGIGFQRMRQKKWIWPADVGVPGVGRDQLLKELSAWFPAPHEAVGDHLLVDSTQLSTRPRNQSLRRPHPEASGDQLVPHQPLAPVELAPGLDHHRALNVVVLTAQSKQPVDPVCKWQLARATAVREHQRDGLGQITDLLIALLEQPFRQAGLLRGPGSKLAR